MSDHSKITVMHGWLVTANDQGVATINARVIAKIDDAAKVDYVGEVVRRFNEFKALERRLKYYEERAQSYPDEWSAVCDAWNDENGRNGVGA